MSSYSRFRRRRTSQQDRRLLVVAFLALAFLMACFGWDREDQASAAPGDAAPESFDAATIARHASVGPFQAREALVISDNDEAFASKLRMVENARSSIDMMYFVYWDDASSSVLTEALLDAAGRGVAVRLLIDYDANYRNLDLFTMMEEEASSGPGSLAVRFYNRPTRQIIRDATFMTMGCSELGVEVGEDCAEQKFEAIDRAFSEEGIPPEKNLSNLNLANSGLFLSGWYTRDPEIMALAVTRSQGKDLDALAALREPGGAVESVKDLALAYWRSRNGSAFQRARNKVKLAMLYATHRGEIAELKDTVTSFLPLRERELVRDWRDWEYLTDFFHQKLLLVDGTLAQMGGRNIGDSYHLRPGPLLADRYFFSDTDVYLELSGGDGEALRRVYDRLWSFDLMVATTAEIRQHAPNDLVANRGVFEAAQQTCASLREGERQGCIARELAAGVLSVEERMAVRGEEMRRQAASYRELYAKSPPLSSPLPTLEVDREARWVYLENLPFLKELPDEERARRYGASGLGEADDGRYIHHLWRQGLENVCAEATAESPRRVILHHAYYLPPANLLRVAGRMINGDLDCRHVTVQVLTNSAATTDFGILNPLAHHGLKAFSDHYRDGSDPELRARFEFYEYRPNPELPKLSLHSKVAILGDDILIGSANADVRSYMMDSNNALLIRGARRLRERYTELMDGLLADPEAVTNLGEVLQSRDREEMRQEHRQLVRSLLQSRLSGLSEEQRATAEELFLKIPDTVYELTLAVLRGEEEELDRYNQLLKLL